MIALAIAAGGAIALCLCMIRLFSGPTLYDRLLALNTAIVKASLIMAAVATAAGQASFAEVAIGALLGNVVVNLSVLKLFRAKSFQPPLARLGEEA